MYKYERGKVVKNWKFGKWNTIMINGRQTKRHTWNVDSSTKEMMYYSILTMTWNKKEENEKLKSIKVAK